MRHNLLIVDDEELIRQGLRARLDYLEIETDEIFEASNGKEALEIVKNHPVDVVITDIRMPDMDGLTMIREIQKFQEHIQFMVLSGYAEFSYAETAISLGVKAYLLKPISNEELKENFQKIYTSLEKKVNIYRAVRMKDRLDREKQEYHLEKEINAFVSGASGGMIDVEHLCQAKGISLQGYSQSDRRMFLAVIDVDRKSYEGEGFSHTDHELIRFSIKNVFHEAESSCQKLVVNSLYDYNRLYALFFLEDERRLHNEIEKIFLTMRSVLEKMNIYITMGVSKCTRELKMQSVNEARGALKQRIIYGDSNLYFYEDIKVIREPELSSAQLHLLNRYLEKNELHKIKELLMEIFSEERVRKYGTPYLRIMWVRIMNAIYHYYEKRADKRAGIEKVLLNMELLEKIRSVEEIRESIIEIIMACARTDNVTEVDVKSRIQMAVQYIKEHYNENITINELAERYEMSPNYFSSMFKKEVQQSTVNYITEIRMEEARKLLERSQLSVVDIAKKVGYEDSQYFFRVFKKYTEMTPLRYREKNRIPG
ncbi:MAG: response regulator [Clostridiales bacterium]|nr:response regulator [Clostridiales bacterium]